MTKRKRRQFTAGFKAAAVKLVRGGGQSITQISLSRRNNTQLALTALEAAIKCRALPLGLLHHTDSGSPYASEVYQAALKTSGIVCSKSRRGDCWDNAVAESFFSTIKANWPSMPLS
jgi:transposase InsO family protein